MAMPIMAVMPTMTLSDYTSLAVIGGRVTSFVKGNVTAGDDVTPGNDPPSNLTIVAPSGRRDAETVFFSGQRLQVLPESLWKKY